MTKKLRKLKQFWPIHNSLFIPHYSRASRAGFTLVELIVVFGIVAGLFSTGVYLNTTGSINKAHDAQRAHDLEQIKSSIELYYHDTNCFPPTTDTTFASALTGGTLWQEGSSIYMKKVPKDPNGTPYTYKTDSAACPQWMMVFSKFSTAPKNFVACPVPPYATDPTCVPAGFDATWGCVSSGNVTCNAPTPTPTPPGVPTPTPTQRQIAWWKMDEASWTVDCSTTSVTDSSGGNNGKSCPASTGPAGGAVGKFGNAGSFDGINDYVYGNIAVSTFAGDWTITAWFNHNAMTSWAGIFSNSVGTNDTAIMTMKDTTTQFGINRVGVSPDGIFVDLGADHYSKWIFGVITREGNTIKVYAYKDGTLLQNSGTLTWTLNTDNEYYIGRHYQSASQIFNGTIDDVRIYNYALSQAEIAALVGPLPGATTVAATSITLTGATLNATINSNGVPTNYWWRYGTSNTSCSSLPNLTTTGTVNSGSSSPTSVLSGLATGTLYHFCAVAQNSANITYGNVLSFSTPMNLVLDADHDGYYTGSASSQIVVASSIINLRRYYSTTTSGGAYSYLDPASALGANDCLDSNSNVYQTVSNLAQDADQDKYYTGTPASQCVGGSTSVGGTPAYKSTGNGLSATQTISVTINVPSGVSSGDVMVAGITFSNGSSVTLTPPSGWILISGTRCDNNDSSGAYSSIAMYYKVAGASEPASYTWTTLSPGVFYAGWMSAYSVIDNSSPIDLGSCQTNGSSSSLTTSVIAPSITTTGTNEMIVTAHGTYGGAYSFTPPAGMTERADLNNTGSRSIESADALQAVAGVTGLKTATVSTASYGASAIVALKPGSTVYYKDSSGNNTWILASSASGIDCLDSDATRWQNLTGWRDADGDTFTLSTTTTACSGASFPAYDISTNPYRSAQSSPLDCYDVNALAKPGQTSYFTTSRSDGSYDWNCDISIQAGTYTRKKTFAGDCSISSALSLPADCGVASNYCVNFSGSSVYTTLACH